jgi:hypothetical protein
VGEVFVFAFTAALNPTLLGATTVMLLLEHPKKMLVGYLLGALMTSITLGLVIVFALQDSGATSTTQKTLSPAADLAIGGLLIAIALVLGTGADQRRKERRLAKRSAKKKKPKGPPRWRRTLDKGSPRVAFVVGAALTLPGGSYIVGLNRIADQDLSTAATVGTVLVFNLIMLMLLEIPLIGYTFAPEWTPRAVDRFKAWIGRTGRRAAVYGAGGIGTLLVVKGLIGLLAV